MFETRFSLGANCQYEDRLNLGQVAIQRDIASSTPADDQFPFSVFHRSADLRTMRKHLDGLDDFLDPLSDVHRVELRHVIQEAIKVVKNFGSKLDSSHDSISAKAVALTAGALSCR